MKYTFVWKDPSWYETCEPELSEDDWEACNKAGIGEYIAVSFDTETGVAAILKPETQKEET